jgi:SMP-30/Gluconolactonase/LRE-like region
MRDHLRYSAARFDTTTTSNTKETVMPTTLSDIVASSQAERLATGFVFTEGPLWHPDGYLLFVDIRRSQIWKLVPGGTPELLRENSGESNGMTFDMQGRVIICEMVNRQVTRMEANGSYTVLADRWNNQRLNRPNDVIGKSDGSLYFTNPGRERLDPAAVEMAFNSVHRIRPDGTVDCVIPNFDSIPTAWRSHPMSACSTWRIPGQGSTSGSTTSTLTAPLPMVDTLPTCPRQMQRMASQTA